MKRQIVAVELHHISLIGKVEDCNWEIVGKKHFRYYTTLSDRLKFRYRLRLGD